MVTGRALPRIRQLSRRAPTFIHAGAAGFGIDDKDRQEDTVMRSRPFQALAILFITSVVLSASAAQAQVTSAGPYYATPSWDQQIPGATRFVVLSNWIDVAHPAGGAAVLDRETGLVWERSPSASNFSTWQEALTHCNLTSVGGRLGWKLPSIQELNSINDPGVLTFPFVPAGHPFIFGLGPLVFWSSTLSALSPAEVLQGNFIISILPRALVDTKDGGSGGAWCVRGGAGAEVQ